METIGRSLRTLWVITKQEFSIFFVSPIVWLIGAIWLFFAGGFFSLALVQFNEQGAEPNMLLVLGNLLFLLIFMAPALTMRLITEELHTGTHELLFTAPVRDWEIVTGKWLGAWGVMAVFILLTLPFPFILIQRGDPEISLIITGYLGLLLMTGAMLAVGVFASSLTQYQLVSFFVSMGILLALYLAELGSVLVTGTAVGEFFSELSMIGHYQNLIQRALIDPMDIMYFVGMILVFLFLATQSLSTRRWTA